MKEKKNKKVNSTNNTSEKKALVKTKQEEVKEEKKNFFKKVFDVLSKKWLVNGLTTLLLVAIIIAIYFGVTTLLDKVTLPEVDCTSNKIYSLSDETKTKVGALSTSVKITLINYGSNDTMLSTIDKYKALNSNITVERIDDLASREDLMQKYSLKSTDTLIIIESGENSKTLASTDLYTYDYSTYEQIDTTEEAITNAIVNVTTQTKPKVYFLGSHEMYDSTTYYSNIMKTIEDDANDVSTVDLLTTGKVPDDCDCLVITTLKEDITDPEKDYITTYINNGGKLLLLCGANLTGVSLPNFQQILDLYGLSIKSGIVFEQETANMLSQYPDIIVESVNSNSTTKNSNMNLKACFVDAGAIDETTDSDKLTSLGVEYETLITTSSKAFIRTNLNITTSSKTSADTDSGTYNLGVLATKKISDDKSSKLILYSDEAFDQIQLGSYVINAYNNQDIVANSIAYLNQRTDTITIRKNYDNVTYSVSQQEHNVIMGIIFGTPIVIIIIGIVVWQVRRKRNK